MRTSKTGLSLGAGPDASPVFVTMLNGRKRCQVDWAGEGHEATKLAYLVAVAGFFYKRHRASNDCLAAAALLGAPLPRSGRLALALLLERARQLTWRIWAEISPFDLKDAPKVRRYRWNGEGNAFVWTWLSQRR